MFARIESDLRHRILTESMGDQRITAMAEAALQFATRETASLRPMTPIWDFNTWLEEEHNDMIHNHSFVTNSSLFNRMQQNFMIHPHTRHIPLNSIQTRAV